MIKAIFLVGIGGFAGSVLRYLSGILASQYLTSPAYWSTFFVNLTGSFVIGIIFALFDRGHLINPDYRLLLATGFCGGFTTFSTFALDNLVLLRDRHFIQFFLYTGGSIFFGILAVFTGIFLVKILS